MGSSQNHTVNEEYNGQPAHTSTGRIKRNIIFIPALLFPALYAASANYYLFHGITELLCVFLNFAVFIIALNTYHITKNHYLMFLGICYGFVSGFDLLHTLATGEVNFSPFNNSSLSVYSWIIARHMESASLLAAPWFVNRKVRADLVFSVYLLLSLVLLAVIFYWGSAPEMLNTPGPAGPKQEASLLILATLLAALLFTVKNQQLQPDLRQLMKTLLLFNAASQAAFLLYGWLPETAAALGHLLRLASSYWMYKIVADINLKEPYKKMYRELSRLRTEFQSFDQRYRDEINERRREERELQRLSYLDGLTGIYNRRFFDQYLDREWRRAIRGNYPLSLIICDIDYFKKYNDKHGHLNGDNCMKKVTAALSGCLKRSSDMVARYGGEEFTVILPDTDSQGAALVAEELRKNVEQLKIPHSDSPIGQYVTISLGVATLVPDQHTPPENIISLADQALYRAKEGGRNRIMT
ncbi:two-component response regulator [Desulfocucumis palustris]|uniref:Two-component response regulator n=1 Tax=Desulfocucumis palustris TaxID=1898651 RepID=A0A2L2X870_9FIRM|nr:diguanylate cyclase [Desulfocucumis palustris]GBF32365.1 two-component response regulator [Desulfocucumis palustris]